MKTAAALCLCLLASLPLGAQDDALTFTTVTGGIHMISGPGGNIGLSVGDDGLLMVDDKFARFADAIRAAYAGVHDGEISFLLNTHYHGDHTGANAIFGAEAAILAHHNVRARLQTDPERPAAALPVLTFDAGVTLHFNGETIEVAHFPRAHTDGDAVVFFTGSDVIHTGDIVFHGRFPYVDIDAGGSVDGVVAAVQAILDRCGPETRIIPGHGDLATPDDLRTHLRMIEETLVTVRAGVDAGRSLEQLQAAGLSDEWSGWSWGFITEERWIATLHRTVTE